jgi:hypothetical protein
VALSQLKPAIPVRLDIELHEGDSWSLGESVTFPGLLGYGYAVNDLTDCVVLAQIKPGYNQPASATMAVDYLSRAERRVRVYLNPVETDGDLSGRWSLQITHTPTGYTRTWLKGAATTSREVA